MEITQSADINHTRFAANEPLLIIPSSIETVNQ